MSDASAFHPDAEAVGGWIGGGLGALAFIAAYATPLGMEGTALYNAVQFIGGWANATWLAGKLGSWAGDTGSWTFNEVKRWTSKASKKRKEARREGIDDGSNFVAVNLHTPVELGLLCIGATNCNLIEPDMSATK